ncbi:MAG: hypothetical protein K5985_08740 [Lachnospiraceae bacterium]|nr:hypothetical protein [Lachnospiraceae bacterium]
MSDHKLNDDELKDVNGGVTIANNALYSRGKTEVQTTNALYDKNKTQVYATNALKTDRTVHQSKLLEEEAAKSKVKNPQGTANVDPFGNSFSSGYGRA